MKASRSFSWPLVGVLLGFLLLAGVYSVVNPLFEAPDEVWHYEYVRWLVEGHGLPRPEDVGSAPWEQEGSQPPLYYLLAAALTFAIPTDNAPAVIRYNPHAAVGQADAFGNKNMMAHGPPERWPWRGVALAAHTVRFFSIVLGALTVAATYGTARLLNGGRWVPAVAAALLVALNPQFLFLSGAISNDNLVTTCCTMGIWLLVVVVTQATPPTRGQLIRLGLIAGAAALSKVSGLALSGLIGLTLIGLAWRDRAPRRLLGQGLLVGGLALAVAGWWYGRNWWLYGDPLGLSAMFAVLPGRDDPLTPAEVVKLVPGVWRSFWAVFGWFNIVVEDWVYRGFTLLTLAGIAGLLWGGWQVRSGWKAWQLGPWLLLGLWLVVIALLVVRWAQISYPQGRLLFPAISAVATLVGSGLCWLLPERRQAWLLVPLALWLIPVAVMAPVRWIQPAYAPPALLAATTQVPNARSLSFANEVALRGFAWEPATLQPGASVELTLFWQALAPLPGDYSVFVHLVDENGIVQAQRDSYPAGGALPTSGWPVGEIVPDRHRLTLPAVLPVPTQLRVDVGLYDFATGRRLQLQSAEGLPQDIASLGSLTVTPADPGDSEALRINFGDQIALVDYKFDRWVVSPGETLTVTLDWQALTVPQDDYVVFVHLLLPPDAVWAQRDAMPQTGAAPTSTWAAGQRVTDMVELVVPAEAPAGLYTVEIGLYDPDTGERLSVNFEDAGVRLGQVRVAAPATTPTE
jgi:hypothetical protein